MPQDNNLDPVTGHAQAVTNLAPFVVIPKKYDPLNPHKLPAAPFAEYPKQPLIPNPKKGKAPIPIYLDDTGLRVLQFNNAREEMEYMRANPEMAAKIAEVNADKPLVDPNLTETNKALKAVTDRNRELSQERNELEDTLAERDAQLAAAQAELAAAKKAYEARQGVSVASTGGVDAPVPTAEGTDNKPRRGRPPMSSDAVKAALKAGGQS